MFCVLLRSNRFKGKALILLEQMYILKLLEYFIGFVRVLARIGIRDPHF